MHGLETVPRINRASYCKRCAGKIGNRLIVAGKGSVLNLSLSSLDEDLQCQRYMQRRLIKTEPVKASKRQFKHPANKFDRLILRATGHCGFHSRQTSGPAISHDFFNIFKNGQAVNTYRSGPDQPGLVSVPVGKFAGLLLAESPGSALEHGHELRAGKAVTRPVQSVGTRKLPTYPMWATRAGFGVRQNRRANIHAIPTWPRLSGFV